MRRFQVEWRSYLQSTYEIGISVAAATELKNPKNRILVEWKTVLPSLELQILPQPVAELGRYQNIAGCNMLT